MQRVQLQLSKTNADAEMGEKEIEGETRWTRWEAVLLMEIVCKLNVGWCMRHRQTSYPARSPRRDTRTNAHLALKHVKHDPSKGPDDVGRERDILAVWRQYHNGPIDDMRASQGV